MWELTNISMKGILAGIGFDIVASIILSVLVAAIFSAASGMSMENQSEYQQALESSFSVRLTFLIGGMVIAFAMGFVAEWYSPSPALINAAICGGALLVFHLVMVYLKPDAAPVWSQAIIIVSVVPLSIMGGWILAITNNT